MEGQSPPLAIDLHRKSNAEHLVAYIKTHHESLLALLPPDTTCADLFGEVENQRPIASFFSASQDAAIGRQLLRFTQMIDVWLVDEKKKTKAMQQRDKRDAQETARKASLKAKRPKLDPPMVPIMAFEDAQLVAEHAQNKRDESMREALLQKGYTASLRVANPNTAPEHIKYFSQDPNGVCKRFGAEYRGESFGMHSIYFPRAALESFELKKREVKTKTSGGKNGQPKVVTPFPYKNYKLPTHGEVISWQEFFGTLVADTYNKSEAAAFNVISKNSSEQIKELCKERVSEVEAKYQVKLDRISTKITEEDLRCERAPPGSSVRVALENQLATSKATRSALIAKQNEETEEIQSKYEGYVQNKLVLEKRQAAKKEKAAAAHDALFTRTPAAGGATEVDGAAALAAVRARVHGKQPAAAAAGGHAAVDQASSDDGDEEEVDESAGAGSGDPRILAREAARETAEAVDEQAVVADDLVAEVDGL